MKGIWNDARLVTNPPAFETASAKLVPACQRKGGGVGIKEDLVLMHVQAYSHQKNDPNVSEF